MAKLIPENNSIICAEVTPSRKTVMESGISYERDDLPVYRVLGKSADYSGMELAEGDMIICNSSGTRLHDAGAVHVIFKPENVVGKIIAE